VIRTVALGLICLADLVHCSCRKEINAAAPEVVMPVVSREQSDRLPLTIIRISRQTLRKSMSCTFSLASKGQASPLPPVSEERLYTTSEISSRHCRIDNDAKAKRKGEEPAAQSDEDWVS